MMDGGGDDAPHRRSTVLVLYYSLVPYLGRTASLRYPIYTLMTDCND